ncbi:MAG: EthD domain-containing protein [Acidimicrobiia bacterium]
MSEAAYKIVALIVRRADLTPAEFRAHYELQHAPLFHRAIPERVADAIVWYSQDHAVALGRGAPAYDCVTEIGFADLDGVRTWSDWYLGPGGQVLRDDEERFMDLDRRVVVVTEVRPLGTGR